MPNYVAQLTRRASFIFVALFAFALTVSPTNLIAQSADKTIPIEYVPPKNPAHQSIYEQMKQGQVLEYVQQALGSLRLPRPLPVKLIGCDGVSNAWYDGEAIAVCYEFIEGIQKNAANTKLPLGITQFDATAGPLLDVFMHEGAHAIFDILDVPIWGREEDAADQFSTYVMLQYDKERARRLILGTAYQYAVEYQSTDGKPQPKIAVELKKFSDEHGITAQRYYNVLCIAYGADPKLFADVVEQQYLPKERAEACEGEYQQVSKAYKMTIEPHVDQKLIKQFSKTRSKLTIPK